MTDISALIIVDVQNDFVEGGSLAVPGGLDLAHAIADLLEGEHGFDFVVTTQDWHAPDVDNARHFGSPPDFVDSWPAHCVAETDGADFVNGAIPYFADARFRKGWNCGAYSGFEGASYEDGPHDSVDLATWLRVHGVTDLSVIGIAGDYCVKATAEDALKFGFRTVVVPEFVVSIDPAATEIVAKQIAEAQR